MVKYNYTYTDTLLEKLKICSENLQKASKIKLNKKNIERAEIESICFSARIEGNSMRLEEVKSFLYGKDVNKKEKDKIEVLNLKKIYDMVGVVNPYSLTDMLNVHNILMKDLLVTRGKFRTNNVAIQDVKTGNIIFHAPVSRLVRKLMEELFDYVINSKEHMLVKSSVFHNEFENIHPFDDGNGRIGRFWQTILLAENEPVFRQISIDKIIYENSEGYYKALKISNNNGDKTKFIEYIIDAINISLEEMI